MKWQLFEVDDEYVESYGREKTISVFHPIEQYFKSSDWTTKERQVEFNTLDEAEKYIKGNKELYNSYKIYCIPVISRYEI